LDGLVNVNGNVNIAESYHQLQVITTRFGVVTGYFDISDNRLLSLEGCPEIVGDGFYCTLYMLTSRILSQESRIWIATIID
jgi:hypothetical protein